MRFIVVHQRQLSFPEHELSMSKCVSASAAASFSCFVLQCWMSIWKLSSGGLLFSPVLSQLLVHVACAGGLELSTVTCDSDSVFSECWSWKGSYEL